MWYGCNINIFLIIIIIIIIIDNGVTEIYEITENELEVILQDYSTSVQFNFLSKYYFEKDLFLASTNSALLYCTYKVDSYPCTCTCA